MNEYRIHADGYVHRKHVTLDACPAGYVNCHPVVVIAPEDREQVERVARAYCEQAYQGRFVLADIAVMQNVLRSLIAPPKPEEPQGLGAVVETPGGRYYVRSDIETCNPWRGPNGVPFEWDDLDGPVRILSEGVQPERESALQALAPDRYDAEDF